MTPENTASPERSNQTDKLICVTVCTVKRPVMLEKCLYSIANQTVPRGWRFCLVVVENSQMDETEKITNRIKAETGIHLVFEVEPNRGIPQARNCAMSAALKLNADWIVFIDDDETAEPGWLDAYCKATMQYDVEILRGPVCLAYPPETPDWYPRLSKPVGETGNSDVMFSTSNLMISQHLISPHGYGLMFNEDMRFTGGSDWEFCTRAVKCGARVIAVSNAVVVEEVAMNRITLQWLLQRKIRICANKSWGRIGKIGWIPSFVFILMQAIIKSVEGIFILLVAAFVLPFLLTKAKYLASKGIISFAAAYGYVLPVLGTLPEPYREVDGH